MNRGAPIVLATLASILAASLPAAAPSAWTQEPESFAGIPIGKRFPAAGEIADCPLFEPFRRENLPDELCVDTSKGVSAEAIALKHVPVGAVTGDGTVQLHDGLVRSLRVTFDARHFAYARGQLLDRFGAPHSRAADEPGETLTWSGTRVVVTLRQDGDRADARGRSLLEIRALTESAR
jgi:hypothetical protein